MRIALVQTIRGLGPLPGVGPHPGLPVAGIPVLVCIGIVGHGAFHPSGVPALAWALAAISLAPLVPMLLIGAYERAHLSDRQVHARLVEEALSLWASGLRDADGVECATACLDIFRQPDGTRCLDVTVRFPTGERAVPPALVARITDILTGPPGPRCSLSARVLPGLRSPTRQTRIPTTISSRQLPVRLRSLSAHDRLARHTLLADPS